MIVSAVIAWSQPVPGTWRGLRSTRLTCPCLNRRASAPRRPAPTAGRPAHAGRLCYQDTMPGWSNPWRDRLAVVAAIALPLAVTAVLATFRTHFPNTDASLVLMLAVVAVAADGYRLAGILAAISASLWFDFFLTRPYERFSITRATDIETTVLVLLTGIAVTEVAVWGRRQHLAATRRVGYLEGINAVAEVVAAGHSPAALISQVCDRLTHLLALRSCQFECGVAGLGKPARLAHNGSVTVGTRVQDTERDGLPADIELLVQTGAALAASHPVDRIAGNFRPGERRFRPLDKVVASSVCLRAGTQSPMRRFPSNGCSAHARHDLVRT